MTEARSHVVLIGDSIFANAAYTRGTAPDVVTHLRRLLPDGTRATLVAIDGGLPAWRISSAVCPSYRSD
jgi:hypothetical protein